VRHVQLYTAMRGVEFLLRSASPCVLTERAPLRLFVQFRSERKAVYALLDYYRLAYESRDTSAVDGQNGPRHCSECGPYWTVPAKVIVVTGPSAGEHITIAVSLCSVVYAVSRASAGAGGRGVGHSVGPQQALQQEAASAQPAALPAPETPSLVALLPLDIVALVLQHLRLSDVARAARTWRLFGRAVARDSFWRGRLLSLPGGLELAERGGSSARAAVKRLQGSAAQRFCRDPTHLAKCSIPHMHE
jgi:hypothetical protein